MKRGEVEPQISDGFAFCGRSSGRASLLKCSIPLLSGPEVGECFAQSQKDCVLQPRIASPRATLGAPHKMILNHATKLQNIENHLP